MKPKKPETEKVYIGFYVTPEIHKALRLMAVENDTSVSHMMRRMAEAKAMEDGKKGVRK